MAPWEGFEPPTNWLTVSETYILSLLIIIYNPWYLKARGLISCLLILTVSCYFSLLLRQQCGNEI